MGGREEGVVVAINLERGTDLADSHRADPSSSSSAQIFIELLFELPFIFSLHPNTS